MTATLASDSDRLTETVRLEVDAVALAGAHEGGCPEELDSGWLTGRSQCLLDDSDPFPTGSTVGDNWAPQKP